MDINNYDLFYFYYNKKYNKFWVEKRGINVRASVIIKDIDDHVIFTYEPFNIKDEYIWYLPQANLYDVNNIKIQIKNENDDIIKEERMILQKNIEDNGNIRYLSGGLLGDFIYQLSVVKEKYLLTGKRGDIYLLFRSNILPGQEDSDILETFQYGVIRAYNDLKEIVLNQEYVSDFKIYNGENIGDYIHLSSWRLSPNLNEITTYENFKNEYKIEWASHKWLDLSKDSMYSDIILISTSEKKFNHFFNFNNLKIYNKKILFATTSIKEYENFKNSTGCDFNMIYFNNLKDYWIAINSCYLFVTCFSSFLAVANALHHNTIALFPNNENDAETYSKNIPNVKWYKNDNENNIYINENNTLG